jgi:hypothetical protein
MKTINKKKKTKRPPPTPTPQPSTNYLLATNQMATNHPQDDALRTIAQNQEFHQTYGGLSAARSWHELTDLHSELHQLGGYIENLFNQHNQTTQYLTYANQLWKLESYLSNKLASDYQANRFSNNKMTTTIYMTRQRYMDKAAAIFYKTWVSMMLRQTLFCILFAAVIISLYATSVITFEISIVLLVVLFLWYFFWFYHQIDLNSRRDHTDPSKFVDFVDPTDMKMNMKKESCLIYK